MPKINNIGIPKDKQKEYNSAKNLLNGRIKEITKHLTHMGKFAPNLTETFIKPFASSMDKFTVEPCETLYRQMSTMFSQMNSEFAIVINNYCLRQVDSHTRIQYSEYVTKLHRISIHCCFCMRYMNQMSAAAGIVSIYDSDFFIKSINGSSSCPINSIYVESKILEKLEELCREPSSGDEDTRMKFIKLLSDFRVKKEEVEQSYSNNTTSVNLLLVYTKIYRAFQESYIKLIYKNIITLFNENIFQCMITFLDQQVQIVIVHNNNIREMELAASARTKRVIVWDI